MRLQQYETGLEGLQPPVFFPARSTIWEIWVSELIQRLSGRYHHTWETREQNPRKQSGRWGTPLG